MEDNLQAIATVAKLEITLQNVTELMTQIQEYHSIFSPLFLRREHREHSEFFSYGPSFSRVGSKIHRAHGFEPQRG
jgi:hypothetical protein